MTAFATAAPPQASVLPERLCRVVVKRGVSVGLLAADDQALALAWVWAGLPADRVMDEHWLNAELQLQLDGPAACLYTDHVELRRWLVDAGGLQREAHAAERNARRQRWQQPGQPGSAA